MSGKEFRELEDEFFVVCARLQLAQQPEERLRLLKELERIRQDSARALTETDLKET